MASSSVLPANNNNNNNNKSNKSTSHGHSSSQAKDENDNTLARTLTTQRSRQQGGLLGHESSHSSNQRRTAEEDEQDSPAYELQWSHLVHAEIISVTSAMRRNSRWSGMSVSGLSMGSLGMNMGLRGRENQKEGLYRNQESPLMLGFNELRSRLASTAAAKDMDAVALLDPFLEVIQSGDTNGPITGAALSSVEKFLMCKIINKDSPNVSQAMQRLAVAATHCKFEASDSVSDEIVLLKILQVLRVAFTSGPGCLLSDESVCAMIETGLSMCCQLQLSEMLRKSAEHTMTIITQTMFEKLRSIPVPKDLSEAEAEAEAEDNEVIHVQASNPKEGEHATATTASAVAATPSPSKETETANSQDQPKEMVTVAVNSNEENKDDATLNNDGEGEAGEETQEVGPPKSYGLPSIRELLRVLISLLNPHDQQHIDRMRLMALSILDVALEAGGRSITKFNVLMTLVSDDMCKFLFQLARTDNLPILTLTLRVISTLFDTMKPCLKLQQELFLSFLLERLSPPAFALKPLPFNPDFGEPLRPTVATFEAEVANGSRAGSPSPSIKSGKGDKLDTTTTAHGEVRELLLECLGQFARAPTFMVDLWVNYDCGLDCADLFQDMIKFLTRNSFPDSTTYSASNSHMLCMDSLLLFINHMVDRLSIPKEESDILDKNLETYETLHKRRLQKELLVKGAAKFDENPKAGLAFLEAHNMIKSLNDPAGLAVFLKTSTRLNKKLLGEFLAKPANSEVLKAFIQLFDFHGKRLDEALRDLLETFRLPGESQQIERIMELFAEYYFASKPEFVASQDAAFILGYAVIMLNTDQHNRGVKERMSLEQFAKNLRGVNNGENFSIEYL
ncbi:GDP/GTP exchange factor for ARF, partial [Podila epigama]